MHKLMPCEVVTRRTMPLMIKPHMSPVLRNSEMAQYCKVLMHYYKMFFHQVKEAFCEPPTDGQTFHSLEPGK